jgi:carbamoyl-phosphate synthase large subunit
LELQFLSHFLPQINFISGRIFRVYGRGSRDVISRFIRSAIRNETIQAYGTEGRFDFIFADDVAEALYRLALSNKNGIVNIGTGHARSIQDVLEVIKEHFPDLKVKESASDNPLENSQAVITRLEEWTGWKPSHTIENAFPKLIAYEKNNISTPFQKKENKRVLISSVAGKAPLVEAVRKAGGKLGLFEEIHGCDANENCLGKYLVDTFWHCPPLAKLSAEDVMSYCEENKIAALIPTRDGELDFFARHAPQWQKKGLHTMVSSPETIRQCLDKKNFSDFLSSHRFPAIQSAAQLDLLDAPLFVVKERTGAGGRNIGLRLSREEAEKQARQLSEPLFQPYIEGREWSVDLYRTREGRVKGSVARLREMVQGGESQVTATLAFPELEQLCSEMAGLLNVYGHAIFQVIEDSDGRFHVIECNPRFGGASTASLAVGLDSFFWFFLESMEISLQGYPFYRSPTEVRQVRFMTDRILPCPSYSI